MVTHLTIRLAWHDRGWDGHICNNPRKNNACIMHEYVRDSINLDSEEANAGATLHDADIEPPACSSDCSTYSRHEITITHEDPLRWRRLPSFQEAIPPNSCTARPYKRMLDPGSSDSPWENDPKIQVQELNKFFDALEPGKSLVFFYIDYPHPLGVEETYKVIVGASLIAGIADQEYYPESTKWDGDFPVWSRCISHGYPENGIRLPYHDYLNLGKSPESIICQVPTESRPYFSYVSEHLDDDQAIVVLDLLAQSYGRGLAEKLISYDWSSGLKWIDGLIDRMWTNRGLYPGICSVLNYLGFEQGNLFQRQELPNLVSESQDSLGFVVDALNEEIELEPSVFDKCWKKTIRRWKRIDESRKNLLKLLCRYGLDDNQVKRIMTRDEWKKAGISISNEMILDNPYLISELDTGGKDSDPIRFGVMDRGQNPSNKISKGTDVFETNDLDDPFRIRAALVETLRDISQDKGHTFMPLDELLDRLKKKTTSDRPFECDRELILDFRDCYEERIVFSEIEGRVFVELKDLASMKDTIRDCIHNLIELENEDIDIPWQEFLTKSIGEIDSEYERLVRIEKENALNKLSKQAFSVLTGAAGTGKTKVIESLLEGLVKYEGHHGVLLLAPTGKARVRLEDATKRDAQTIHQFLFKNGWIDEDTYSLKTNGEKVDENYGIVVVDESSMIPLDLFATLVSAISWNRVKRLILVGDPNQLPPIGPGRPFVDILAWLMGNDREQNIAALIKTVRHRGKDSEAIALAQSFRMDSNFVDDDEILSKIARCDLSNDLDVRYWKTPEELQEVIIEELEKELNLDFKKGDYKVFNATLGLDDKNARGIENWQMLSPTRVHHYGTIETNKLIQDSFRKGLIQKARGRKFPNPFGPDGLVYFDKVVQLINKRRWCSNRNEMGYVANGEVGVILGTHKGKTKGKDSFNVAFSSQPEDVFKYSRNQADQLELAYALTVHKAQGSEFERVFLILPKDCMNVSRELLYTGLTRFRKKMILLIQDDISILMKIRRLTISMPSIRWTNLFGFPDVVPKNMLFIPEGLIHRTAKGEMVRSKSEVIVADTLCHLGIDYDYEERLENPNDSNDFRLPDFTIHHRGKVFYWEHLGMLSDPDYANRWARKLKWYEKCGYEDVLITSEDGPDGSIDSSKIEMEAKKRVLLK